MSDQTLDLPKDFDLTLSSALIRMDAGEDSAGFELLATVADIGTFEFAIHEQGSQWGFTCGLDLQTHGLKKLPGLQDLGQLLDFVSLEEAVFVLSSADAGGFTFPDITTFGPGHAGHRQLRVPDSLDTVPLGMGMYAQLGGSNDDGLTRMLHFAGLSSDVTVEVSVVVSLPDPITASKLALAVDYKVSSGVHLEGQVGVAMTEGDPSVFVAGTIETKLQDQPVKLTVEGAVAPGGIYVFGEFDGELTFDSLTIADIVLEIGIDEEGIPTVGFAGTIADGSFDSSVAILIDSTDPTNSLLAGSISDLTLADILKVLTHGSAPKAFTDVLERVGISGTGPVEVPMPGGAEKVIDELNHRQCGQAVRAVFDKAKHTLPAGSASVFVHPDKDGNPPRWFVTDLSKLRTYTVEHHGKALHITLDAGLRFVPTVSHLGTQTFQPGYEVHGTLNLFGVQGSVAIDLEPTGPEAGLTINASMDPIHLMGDVFTLTADHSSSGPFLVVSTHSRNRQLHLSGAVTLFGLKVFGAMIDATPHGLRASLTEMAEGVTYDMHLSIDGDLHGKPGVSGGGDAGLKLDLNLDLGSLGKVDAADIQCLGDVDFAVNTRRIECNFSAHFHLEIADITIIPSRTISLELHEDPQAFLNLAKTVTHHIESEAKKAGKDLFHDAKHWAMGVARGVITGVEDAKSVLKKEFGKAEDEADEIWKDANLSVGVITEELKNQIEGYEKHAEGFFEKALGELGDTADSAIGTIENAGSEVIGAVESVGNKAINAVESVVGDIGKGVSDVIDDIF